MPTKIKEYKGYIYPKYKTNIYLIGEAIKKMKRGYSPIILICGKQRSGKSFIALWIARLIMLHLHKKKFNPKTHVFFDPLKAIIEIDNIEKQPIIIDEAGVLLHSGEWWEKLHIAFDKVIQTQGYKCNCYIFVLPFATDLDKKFRKHIDYQVLMRRRGYFSVFEFIKKYGEMRSEIRSYKRILKENVSVTLDKVPKDLWAGYEILVMKLKETLRQHTIEKIETMRQKTEWQPFGRRG